MSSMNEAVFYKCDEAIATLRLWELLTKEEMDTIKERLGQRYERDSPDHK